jgi:hypothetical protein
MKVLELAAAAALVALTGACGSQLCEDDDGDCGGEPGTDEGSTANARTTFMSTVAPIVVPQCGGTSCHGGGGPTPFLQGADPYDAIVRYSASVLGGFDKTMASIIAKAQVGHQGVTWDATTIGIVGAWLDEEKLLRGSGTGEPSAATNLMREWSGCMEEGDFRDTQMAEIWGALEADQSQCQTCHVNGGNQFMANQLSNVMWDYLFYKLPNSNRYYMEQFFRPSPTGDEIIVSTGLVDMALTALPPYTQHPKLKDIEEETGYALALDALNRFAYETSQNKANGRCQAPRIR